MKRTIFFTTATGTEFKYGLLNGEVIHIILNPLEIYTTPSGSKRRLPADSNVIVKVRGTTITRKYGMSIPLGNMFDTLDPSMQNVYLFAYFNHRTEQVCIIEIEDMPPEKDNYRISLDNATSFLMGDKKFPYSEDDPRSAEYANVLVRYLEEWGIPIGGSRHDYACIFEFPLEYETDGVVWNTLHGWYEELLRPWGILLHDDTQGD